MGAECAHHLNQKSLVLFTDRMVTNCPMKLGTVYPIAGRLSRVSHSVSNTLPPFVMSQRCSAKAAAARTTVEAIITCPAVR